MKSSAPANCKSKIAIVGRLDHQGGVQSVILSLTKGLNSTGIIPDLLWDAAPNRALLEERNLLANYVPIKFRVPTRLLDRLPVTASYLLRTANVFRDEMLPVAYDFIYIFYNGFLTSGRTPHVRFLSGPPLLPQLEMASPGPRGYAFRLFRDIYKRVLKARFPVYEYHRNSEYVINARYTAELFQEAHGVSLPVVYPPIPITGGFYREEDLPGRVYTTFFSRFAQYKRPDLVLDLARNFPEQKFLLMGGVRPKLEDYYLSLVKRAERDSLANVTFLNTPPDEKVRSMLAKTLFYVFPGVNEHFGMATVEAIAFGAIPFVHDSGGQQEIVPDSRLRFTDDAFLQKYTDLLSLSPVELNAIRRAQQEHIQQYSEQVFIDKMLAYLEPSIESEYLNEVQTTAVR